MLAVRRRLAVRSLYRKRLIEIRELVGQQGFALAKQRTGYQLVGPKIHRHRLYDMIEQTEELGEILKPKDPLNPQKKAWQRHFWGSDLRDTINLPEPKSWVIQNQNRMNKGILVDSVGAKEIWFIPEVSLTTQDPQPSRGILGQLVICPGGGEGPQGEMLGIHLNKGSSSVFLKQNITHAQMLTLWLQISQETNPRRMAENMEFWMPGGIQRGDVW